MARRSVVRHVMLVVFAVWVTACAEAHDPPDSSIVPCEVEPSSCTPTNPCQRGEWRCTSDGEPTCAALESLPAGVPCEIGLACDEMARCSVCTPGATCDTGMECLLGQIDCTSGAPVCIADELPIPDCPMEDVCGMPCDTGDPCESGVYECSTDTEPVCVVGGVMPEGTGCGPGVACDPLGGCAVCVEGQNCDTGDPCARGSIDCTTGDPLCLRVARLPEGTPCGVAGVCGATGLCSECTVGAACELGDGCALGALDCAAGTSECVFSSDLPAGVPCGEGGVCDGMGLCEGG